MKTPGIFINSVGTYLPDVEWSQETDEEVMLGAAVAGDTPTAEMALSATRQALTRWGGSTSSLALLLFVEVNPSGPDGWLPQSYLQSEAVGGHVLSAGLRQGCNGVFGALELAAGYLQAQPEPRGAVITTADNHDSAGVDRWTALKGFCMGDGAASIVVSRTPGFARLCSVGSTTITELEGLHRGDEPLHPSSLLTGKRTSFQERSEAFINAGRMTEDVVVKLLKSTGEVISGALDDAGIGVADIAKVVTFHGPWWGLEPYFLPLGIPKERTTWAYGRRVGHSSNDHLFDLDHLVAEGEVKPGDHLLLFGVGPGLGLAAAVIEILSPAPWLGQP